MATVMDGATITAPIVTVPDSDKDAIVNWINQQEANDYESGGKVKTKYIDEVITSNTEYANMSLKDMGIWGAPYQFNQYADEPNGNIYQDASLSNYIGRNYEERLLINAPIVYFEVGKPVFMAQMNKDKSVPVYVLNLLSDVANIGEGLGDKETVNDEAFLAGKHSKMRYYDFEDAFSAYATHVNAMARFTAIKMGLGSKTCPINNKPYRAFDIYQIGNRLMVTSTLKATALAGPIGGIIQTVENAKNVLNESHWHVPFYCNAQSTNVSENINNTTGESLLSQTLKTSGQFVKELSFLLDTSLNDSIFSSNMDALKNTISNLTGGLSDTKLSGLLKNVMNGGATIISGANMMMPLIWQDSSFTKSYSISIHLSTPYGDPEAVFNDIYVPLFCVLAMSMPRQSSDYGYSSPFIIKAHSKGYFNCDMGMIESVDIKRGGQEGTDWTKDSLPTELDINITIKDLYPALVTTSANTSSFAFATNSGLVEYLNMMAGINLSAIRPADNLLAGAAMIVGTLQNIPYNIERNVSHAVYSGIKKFVNNYLP